MCTGGCVYASVLVYVHVYVCVYMHVCMGVYVRVSVCVDVRVSQGSLTSSCQGTQWKTVASGAASHPDHSRGVRRERTIILQSIFIKCMCLYSHWDKHASNSEMH